MCLNQIFKFRNTLDLSSLIIFNCLLRTKIVYIKYVNYNKEISILIQLEIASSVDSIESSGSRYELHTDSGIPY